MGSGDSGSLTLTFSAKKTQPTHHQSKLDENMAMPHTRFDNNIIFFEHQKPQGLLIERRVNLRGRSTEARADSKQETIRY